MNDQPCENTDRELWREQEGNYYADSIHVTKEGGIGINCDGTVFVKTLREWHKLACLCCEDKQKNHAPLSHGSLTGFGLTDAPTDHVKAQGQIEPYPDSMKRGPLQELWDFFCDEHGLNLTDTELHDIVDAVAKYQRDLIGEQALRDADSVPNGLSSDVASVNPKPSVSSEAASVKPETITRELHRIVPTAIIQNAKGECLILKRSDNLPVFPGRWTVPGGGLSMDDYEHTPPTHVDDRQWYNAVETALRREVREETGLEIGALKYLMDVVFIRPDGIPVVVLSFTAPHEAEEVVLSEENSEFAWVTYEQAKAYDFVGDILLEIKIAQSPPNPSGWISFDPSKGGRKPTREDANTFGQIAVREEDDNVYYWHWNKHRENFTHFLPLCYTSETPETFSSPGTNERET